MESREYETLFRFESSYWWYKGLHGMLLDALHDLGCDKDAVLLDAGCGTGQNLRNVLDRITGHAFGFDLAAPAAKYWAKRSLNTVCRASANDIPFQTEMFDFVMSVDLLECAEVEEQRACDEMWRVLKIGGCLILVVPAYEWLMNEEHHKAVHAARRYSMKRVRSLLTDRPMEIVRMTHLFPSVLPAVAFHRLIVSRVWRRPSHQPASDLRPMAPIFNWLLLQVANIERRVLRSSDLPFGSTIMAVVRKIG